ncbi:cupin domain-containing protein [Glutamicibacter sp. NPDC087344]|uniref:cupin domain-containing protein n=1 Tax=Glutamicibacter sp. NPDC087344 TaxID=3363994 RepID=UPI0038277629
MSQVEPEANESVLIATNLQDSVERHPVKPGKYAAKRIFSGQKAQITEIVFDAGVELPNHVARAPIIVQVISGEVEFTVGDATSTLGAGGSIFVEANVQHAVFAVTQARITVTFLSA